jgi:hypothetical protein
MCREVIIMHQKRSVCWCAVIVLVVLTVFVSLGLTAVAAEPLSKGKPYSYVGKGPLSRYPDTTGAELTDGVLPPSADYMNPNWVGFWSTEPFAVTIDLGSSMLIKQVRSFHMAGIAGIIWPPQMMVVVSDDNEEWSEPVEWVPEATPSSATTKWLVIDNINLQGRYVQLAFFPPREGKNIFTGEIEVY